MNSLNDVWKQTRLNEVYPCLISSYNLYFKQLKFRKNQINLRVIFNLISDYGFRQARTIFHNLVLVFVTIFYRKKV